MGRNIKLWLGIAVIALIAFFIGLSVGTVATLKSGIYLFQKIAHVEFTSQGRYMIEQYFQRTGGDSLLNVANQTQVPTSQALLRYG